MISYGAIFSSSSFNPLAPLSSFLICFLYFQNVITYLNRAAPNPDLDWTGLWDCFSLLMAYKYILQGKVALHKKWMVRNFAIGAGHSIRNSI